LRACFAFSRITLGKNDQDKGERNNESIAVPILQFATWILGTSCF